MPEKLLHHIPDSMTYDEAALVEPTANVVQDVIERGGVAANDFVVVLGPGPIGLLSVMAARAAGAREIALVGVKADMSHRGWPKARSLELTILSWQIPRMQLSKVAALTGGRGADVVVEASGAAAAIASTVAMVRRLGRIAVIGMSGREQISFPWNAAIWKMCTIVFNLSTGYTSWEKAIGLIASKKIEVAKLITHRLPLADWQTSISQPRTRAKLSRR